MPGGFLSHLLPIIHSSSSNNIKNKMPRVQVEEDDYAFTYMDHPDHIITEDKQLPEKLPPQQQQQTQQPAILSYFNQQHISNNRTSISPSSTKPTVIPPMGDQNQLTSAENHYNRLKASSSMLLIGKSASNLSQSSRQTRLTNSDELNETAHFVRGKGILASKKDVNVPPDGKIGMIEFFFFNHLSL